MVDSFNVKWTPYRVTWDERDYLGQAGLWAHLGRIILMTLIKMGKNHPLWVVPFPRKGIMHYVKAETKVEHQHACIHSNIPLCS